jgi:hypothetical protein
MQHAILHLTRQGFEQRGRLLRGTLAQGKQQQFIEPRFEFVSEKLAFAH